MQMCSVTCTTPAANLKSQLRDWPAVQFAICHLNEGTAKGYIEFKQPVRHSSLQAWWPRGTFERRCGSAAEAAEACRGENGFQVGLVSCRRKPKRTRRRAPATPVPPREAQAENAVIRLLQQKSDRLDRFERAQKRGRQDSD